MPLKKNFETFVEKANELSTKKLKTFLEENYSEEKDLKFLEKVRDFLDDKYYNDGESPVDDARYDVIKDFLSLKNPKKSPKIGAKLRAGENRAELPFWLGSADKISPENSDVLQRWKTKNPAKKYMVSYKLDGVSCLMTVKNQSVKLYTRGDGKVGADISYLATYFSGIPNKFPKNTNIAVRGELIMSREKFEPFKKGLLDGERLYKNPRNMVAGLIGAKTARKGLSSVEFIAYEMVGDSMPKISEQFQELKKLGFTVVEHELIDTITMKKLEKLFMQAKKNSPHDVDGVIIQSNVEYDRNTSGNPDYMFAFKMAMEDSIKEAKIIDIEWNASKWGQLKPVVIIEPIELEDITIKRVTAHNAKYVEDNNLGPGAIIKVTRSKEVIPYIVDVVKGAKKPKMPDVEYVWDKNHVNIITKEDDSTPCIKLLAGFFAKMGIKFVSEKTAEKMYNNGLDNLLKILGASKKRLMEIKEFKEKSAERIYTNIREKLKKANLPTLLGSSGIFGFGLGRKRMDMLFLDIPNLLELPKTHSTEKIKELVMKVEGFSDITATQVAANVKNAAKFVKMVSKYVTFKTQKRVSDDMKGKKYVMSGFRDKSMEEKIASRGGKVTTSVSKNTTALIVADKSGKLTGKPAKAQELGVKIYSREEFEKLLGDEEEDEEDDEEKEDEEESSGDEEESSGNEEDEEEKDDDEALEEKKSIHLRVYSDFMQKAKKDWQKQGLNSEECMKYSLKAFKEYKKTYDYPNDLRNAFKKYGCDTKIPFHTFENPDQYNFDDIYYIVPHIIDYMYTVEKASVKKIMNSIPQAKTDPEEFIRSFIRAASYGAIIEENPQKKLEIMDPKNIYRLNKNIRENIDSELEK